MLSIFYNCYPNEITYSWFARYSHINGDIGHTTISKELFGKECVKSTILYPTCMENFIKQLPIEWNITINEVINRNTIIPLFLPFMEKERANKIISNIKDGDTRRLIGEIGINTGDIFKEEDNIKICPKCYEEDKEKYGEAYIHRNYQVPGNYICSIHEESLYKCSIPSNIQRCEYIDINKINISNLEMLNINELYNDLYLNLSRDIDYVLNGCMKEYDTSSIKRKYKDKLEEKGFSISGGRIPIKKIIGQFNEFYPKEFLEHLESYINMENRKNWIGLMLTDCCRFIHPIRQLLFIRFLFGGIEEFIIYEKKNIKPFGEGPWMCLNPVCRYYKQPVIKEIKYRNFKKKPVGIFTCLCGYSYSRVGPDKCESDKNRCGKIEEFGEVWVNILRNLIKEGCSISEIARQMSCYRNTIIKQATKLGLIDMLNTKHRMEYKTVEKKISNEVLDEYKNNILNFIKENSTANRQKVKEALSKECSLIYIRDRKWWNENLPKAIKVSEFTVDYKDINWEEREKELIPLILNAIEKIKNEEKPRRITKTYIAKKMNQYMICNRRNLERLPLVNEIIKKNCETISEFNIRKNFIKKHMEMKVKNEHNV
ncbi:hypothetical protein DIC82_05600 [Clostridium beijerinckii]|nr:hypothetical protein DIC82_05600 [Clostridium beijerinckii]